MEHKYPSLELLCAIALGGTLLAAALQGPAVSDPQHAMRIIAGAASVVLGLALATVKRLCAARAARRSPSSAPRREGAKPEGCTARSRTVPVGSMAEDELPAGGPSPGVRLALLIVLTVHCSLLGLQAFWQSPTPDEMAHLAAGLHCVREQRFDDYPVNPPLVKCLGAIGASALDCNLPPIPVSLALENRPEFLIGDVFLHANPGRFMPLLSAARLACIPLSLAGALGCYVWAARLASARAGLVAAILWCSCPNILGHGALITADVAGAALAIWSCLAFARWMERPTPTSALLAGAVLGVALLAKFTCLLLVPALATAWFCVTWRRRKRWAAPSGNHGAPPAHQLALLILASLLVVNYGYRFQGSLEPLGSQHFVSRSLAAPRQGNAAAANRFSGTLVGNVPSPFPSLYLRGLDLQMRDLEHASPCYLNGTWQRGGWWYFYVLALLYKVPASSLILFVAGIAYALRRNLPLGDVLALLIPPALVLLAACSSSARTVHFRYVLGCLPFLFILSAVAIDRVPRLRLPGVVLVVLSVATGACVFPHSMSYFSRLAGGPLNGHKHLLDSNLDWGQDLLHLKRWCERHPQARPLFVTVTGTPPHLLGIESQPIPVPFGVTALPWDPSRAPRSNPPAGWYIISANKLLDQIDAFDYLRNRTAVSRIGYSLYCYRLTTADAAAISGATRGGLPPARP
jgi:hypothetical protein